MMGSSSALRKNSQAASREQLLTILLIPYVISSVCQRDHRVCHERVLGGSVSAARTIVYALLFPSSLCLYISQPSKEAYHRKRVTRCY
ncbi:hypothetical protein BDW66DRAFT_128596 [Aspergillus desertorum]